MNGQEPRLIVFPKIRDVRGNLTFVQSPEHIPFGIQKAEWLSGFVHDGAIPGRILKETDEVLIALSGSFEIETLNLRNRKSWFLNVPDQGLYVPASCWRKITSVSSNAVLLCLYSYDFGPSEIIYPDYS